jgi:hypothetical protein
MTASMTPAQQPRQTSPSRLTPETLQFDQFDAQDPVPPGPIAVYIRVSKDSDSDSPSLARQRASLQDELNRLNGMFGVVVFVANSEANATDRDS